MLFFSRHRFSEPTSGDHQVAITKALKYFDLFRKRQCRQMLAHLPLALQNFPHLFVHFSPQETYARTAPTWQATHGTPPVNTVQEISTSPPTFRARTFSAVKGKFDHGKIN
jgi:hypothetical protein